MSGIIWGDMLCPLSSTLSTRRVPRCVVVMALSPQQEVQRHRQPQRGQSAEHDQQGRHTDAAAHAAHRLDDGEGEIGQPPDQPQRTADDGRQDQGHGPSILRPAAHTIAGKPPQADPGQLQNHGDDDDSNPDGWHGDDTAATDRKRMPISWAMAGRISD